MPQIPLFSTYAQSQALLKGNDWFVNAAGSDSYGGTQMKPFATLAKALQVAGAGDTVYIQGTLLVTATVVIATNNINIVGLDAPSGNCRSRISSAGTTPFSPLVNVTASGCRFINLGTFHGGFTTPTGSQVCWAEAGGRNYYENCQFLGGGDAVAAALAGMRSLTITGQSENLFVNCTIGLDTIARGTAANASLEFLGSPGSARNVFRNCIFQMLSTLSTNVHVTAGGGTLDRTTLFDNCTFTANPDSTGTTIAADFTISTTAGGSVIVQGGASIGATAVSASGPVYVSGAVPAASTSSLAVAAS